MRKITSKNIFVISVACISDEYINIVKSEGIISEIDNNILMNIIEKYRTFYDYVLKENLLNTDKLNPLISGEEITKNFKVKTNVNQLKEYLVEEQIKNPNISRESEIDLLNNKIKELVLAKKIKIKG